MHLIPLLSFLVTHTHTAASLSGSVIGSNSSRGSIISDHKLKLKETFSRHEKHILRPGDRLSLKCVACGTPLPTITWNLDAFPIPETHRIQYGDYVRYPFPFSPSSGITVCSLFAPTVAHSMNACIMFCHPTFFSCDAHTNRALAARERERERVGIDH